MICDCCKKDKLVSDFIKNKNICCQCTYQIKLKKSLENRTEKVRRCRICKNEIIHQKNAGKRQRDVFCSKECALKGHQEQIDNYWARPRYEVTLYTRKSGKVDQYG